MDREFLRYKFLTPERSTFMCLHYSEVSLLINLWRTCADPKDAILLIRNEPHGDFHTLESKQFQRILFFFAGQEEMHYNTRETGDPHVESGKRVVAAGRGRRGAGGGATAATQ